MAYLFALLAEEVGVGLFFEEDGVLVDQSFEVGFCIGAVEENLYDLVLEGESGFVAVLKIDLFVLVGVKQLVLALDLDELLPAG